MSQVLKTYLTLFLIFIMLFTVIGIITADMDVSNARAYQDYIIDQIESSDLSSNVIEACKSNADEKYDIQTKNIKDDTGKVIAVEITIKYNYTIKLLNVVKSHQLVSYAR